jgi:hypothetical protein
MGDTQEPAVAALLISNRKPGGPGAARPGARRQRCALPTASMIFLSKQSGTQL